MKSPTINFYNAARDKPHITHMNAFGTFTKVKKMGLCTNFGYEIPV